MHCSRCDRMYKVRQMSPNTNFWKNYFMSCRGRQPRIFQNNLPPISIMFLALWPLFKTAFKILNRKLCQTSFMDDLMSSISKKCFPFSILHDSINSQKTTGTKSGEYGRWSAAEMPFSPKNCDIQSKVSACCHGEESMMDLSTVLLVCASRYQWIFLTPPHRISD